MDKHRFKISIKHWLVIFPLRKYRIQLNRLWLMIHNKVFNFHDWILCYHEPFHDKIKAKSIGIINGSTKFKYYESYLNLSNAIFAELWFPFPCIDSFAFMKSNSDMPLLKILCKNLQQSCNLHHELILDQTLECIDEFRLRQ